LFGFLPPPLPGFGPQLLGGRDQGAAEKINEKTTYICASSQKKVRTHLLYFFNIFFSAFLGVSRQGEFENTRKEIEYVSKKNHRGNIFSGGNFFPGDFF
jgi:hypothetical protein